MRKGAKECFEVLAEGQEKNIKSEIWFLKKQGKGVLRRQIWSQLIKRFIPY